jgi:hypothetical protein
MARKLPPFRFKKASFAKAHPGKCKRVSTPSGPRWLCRVGGKKKRSRR